MEKIESELKKLTDEYSSAKCRLHIEEEQLREDDRKREMIANKQQGNVDRTLRIQEINSSLENNSKKYRLFKNLLKGSIVLTIVSGLLAYLTILISAKIIATSLIFFSGAAFAAGVWFCDATANKKNHSISLEFQKNILHNAINRSYEIINLIKSELMTSETRQLCVDKRASILDELETLEVKIYNLLNSVPESKESDYIKGVRETFKPKYADLPADSPGPATLKFKLDSKDVN